MTSNEPSTGATQHARYGFGATLDSSFDDALERTKAALKTEGFGVLTTIDVRQTLKEKIDVDFERYVILGACNPVLAHRALLAEHELGLLLPCNVIVHEHGEQTVVSVIDPAQMLGVAGDNPALTAVAKEANVRLRRVVAALEDANTPIETSWSSLPSG
jgi:uncharacterized protein (DUF302 family)